MFCLGISISGVLVEVREVLEKVPLLSFRKGFFVLLPVTKGPGLCVTMQCAKNVMIRGWLQTTVHFTHSDVQWGSSFWTDVLAYSEDTFKMQFRSRFAIRDEK